MIVLGLTGSIGMGKSTAARLFRRRGVWIHDADATVHRLLGPGGAAVTAIGEEFQGVVRDGIVDRAALGQIVYREPAALRRLEGILHPLVRRAERRFLGQAARARIGIVGLDIPLLFETGAERRVDVTVVVTAPRFLQRQRVLRRPGMTVAKLDAILSRQVPDVEKRRRADHVLHSGLGRGKTMCEIKKLLRAVKAKRFRCAHEHRCRRKWVDHARNCSRYRNDRP